MEFVDVGKLIKNLNPVNGCTIGCKYCYAKRINDRFHITPVWEEPQFIEERLKRIGTKKASTYLMTSMSDFPIGRKTGGSGSLPSFRKTRSTVICF